MSGWDVSSTPTWGSQDGPEETQAFAASGDGARDYGQDFGAPEFGGGYPGENMAGGPPPEFFGQDHERGQTAYPQRTPGQSFQDLPRRDMPSRGRHGGGQPAGGYGQDNGYPQDNGGFPQPQDNGYGHEAGYGQDNGAYGHDTAFGQDWGAAPAADQGESWGHGGQDDGGWGRTAGRSVAPWDERPQQDPGYGDADGFGRQDFGRQPESPGYAGQDYGSQDYASQDFPGQPGRGGQAPQEFGRQGRDLSARNDPALQDFFSPSGNGGGFADQGPEWAGAGGARPAAQDPDVDWTGRPRQRPAAEPELDWTGRPKRTGPPPRDDDDDDSRGIGMKGLVAIGAVVVVVIAAAAYMFLHKGSSSTPTASNTPAGGTMSSAPAAPTGSAAAGGGTGKGTATGAPAGGAAAPGFTLSTPATAAGYAKAEDATDLTNAKTTAGQIVTAISGGGAGTVKGDPVSAAYALPSNQHMTFVGYTGTFTPDKVATVLAKLGTDAKSYPAGPNGGVLGCSNTSTKPSGAVCVWATASTLGITEFYDANGPEALVASQSKGADHTKALRADVEKKA